MVVEWRSCFLYVNVICGRSVYCMEVCEEFVFYEVLMEAK
jgi:hypothetical protein